MDDESHVDDEKRPMIGPERLLPRTTIIKHEACAIRAVRCTESKLVWLKGRSFVWMPRIAFLGDALKQLEIATAPTGWWCGDGGGGARARKAAGGRSGEKRRECSKNGGYSW